MKTGVAIFAHGSAVESANEAVRATVAEFIARSGCELVETSFLELGQPDLRGAVERLVARGAVRVVVVPYFLTPGKHLQRDLPRIVSELEESYPGIQIAITPPLDGHPGLADILADRAKEALAGS